MTYICTICGYEGLPRKLKRGSAKMEWMIYGTLLVPGPLYSLYRRLGLPKVCPNCKADRMVKLSSDAGQIAQRQMDLKFGLLPERKKPDVALVEKKPELSPKPPKPEEKVDRQIDPDAW